MGVEADYSQSNDAAKPDDKKAKESGVKKEIAKFVGGTDSLVATAPLALWAVEAAHRGAYKEYKLFWDTKCVNTRTNSNGALVSDVPPDLLHEYRIIRRRFDRSSAASR